ncbi:hypothetical protein N7494_000711 [Penicillium frequentans]|uniref:protein S-acyltransferase n=1 Tax=Penicillium frequentans TaxID=3151616 RepID=A0AAD6D6N3_9EURO|nr:hypothetical protein N7494_000711 [Penicillium glabrum]
MPLTQLPPEILLQIAYMIDKESDLASFVQVNRGLYQTLISQLYLRNAKDSGGTAILHAARSGNCSTLQKALQAWTDATSPAGLPVKPDQPLLLAAKNGNLPAVKMLIEYGADPNIRGQKKCTPLIAASQYGHTAVVATLLAHPNIKKNAYSLGQITPINIAAQNGHTEIVKMLLSSGAHAGFARENGLAPLHSAVLDKDPELVRLLMNQTSVDPNALFAESRFSDLTPLHIAVKTNKEELVKILLTDKRINPDITAHPLSQTPLLDAVIKDNEVMVRLLLEAGARKDIKDRSGLSPAMLLDAASAKDRGELLTARAWFITDLPPLGTLIRDRPP